MNSNLGSKHEAHTLILNDIYPKDFEEIVLFHGHLCPWLVMGYRAAKIAAAALQVDRSEDEELVAIVETDACGVDVVQVVLGCTLGKGNLLFRDYGKQVLTVISRKENHAVRIAMKSDALQRTPEQEELLKKVQSGMASKDEHREYDAFQGSRVDGLLSMPDEALFTITEVVPEAPEKARIFKSVVCHYCGERVMEPRARIRDGEIACIPCSEVYSRGW
jgi:formylmethanofuran dehydrogenase subunit E